MCKYCKNLKNSDDVESVNLASVDFGQIFGHQISLSMDLDCYECGECGSYEISSYFSLPVPKNRIASIRINYCPICGRKLSEG